MDEKTIIYQEPSASNMMAMIAPLLAKSGIDANSLLAMNNGNFGGNNFMWVIFLFFLMGNGGWNGGNNGNLANLINNNDGRNTLMQAINGNQESIRLLASTLNTSTQNISNAICQLNNSVNVGTQQTINAMQQGNCQLANQISQFSGQTQLQNCQQTNALTNAITSSSLDLKNAILGKLDAMTMQELNDKIDALREKNSTLQAEINNNAQTQAITHTLTVYTKDLTDAIERVKDDVDAIKRNQPPTAVVQYPQIVGVNASNLYANAYNQPYWG